MCKITPSIFRHQIIINTDQVRHLLDEIGNLQTMITADEISDRLGIKPSSKSKPVVCQCCGAPFHGDKCEYCGVEY